jgi:hypothetical protein
MTTTMIETLRATAVEAGAPQPPVPPTPAVRVEYLWSDPISVDDLNDEGRGTLAYVSYVCGEGDGKVEIAFCVDRVQPPLLSLFGCDAIPLDAVYATMSNLTAVLADPRVRAALATAERQAT